MSRVVRRIGIIAVFVLVIGAFAGCGKKESVVEIGRASCRERV